MGGGVFDSFVILGGMRTGSNFLETRLNTVPKITCFGELFNPKFIRNVRNEPMLGYSLEARDQAPVAFWDAVKRSCDGLPGFRLFDTHDPRILAEVLGDKRCAKIILTRNPLDSFLSLRIAVSTDQWLTRSIKALKVAPKVHFDPSLFASYIANLQSFHLQICKTLQTSGQAGFFLDYADLHDDAVLQGLCDFLGVGPFPAEMRSDLLRQNAQPATDKVTNPEEMLAALAQIDPFEVNPPPHVEARRPPPLPEVLAGGPLLYLPLNAVFAQPIADWLAQFGDLRRDFTRQSLRDWFEAHPQHRSFSVLRHPVARAHDAYCAHNMDRGTVDIDFQMKKVFDMMPIRFRRERPSLDDYRIGFIAFVKWLGFNLAGQTERAVAPEWASQAALVESLGALSPPDLILRETRIDAGLRFLSAELDREMRAAFTPPAADQMLAMIYNSDVEAAVRSTYARDYMQFGFDDWRL